MPSPAPPLSLTVVIPALNEEARIADAVASARAAGPGVRPPTVIVVDGGSRDGTARAARRAGAKVRKRERGRERERE
jgi:glycosyltransferase involved in cell wall biosynthesis